MTDTPMADIQRAARSGGASVGASSPDGAAIGMSTTALAGSGDMGGGAVPPTGLGDALVSSVRSAYRPCDLAGAGDARSRPCRPSGCRCLARGPLRSGQPFSRLAAPRLGARRSCGACQRLVGTPASHGRSGTTGCCQVVTARDKTGFQPSWSVSDRRPGTLPQAGMKARLWRFPHCRATLRRGEMDFLLEVGGMKWRKRQPRQKGQSPDTIPAWGNAPGS